MKSIKPYKGEYLLILGSGKVQFWDEQMLKIMSMAYDELRLVDEEHRKEFKFSDDIERLFKRGILS